VPTGSVGSSLRGVKPPPPSSLLLTHHLDPPRPFLPGAVPTDKIRTFVRRMRNTYFNEGRLVAFTDDFLEDQVPPPTQPVGC